MNNRQQHIEAGALAEYGSECRALHHFTKGAMWTDDHPADETIHRIVRLYKRWYTTESQTSIVDYVKKHWEDKL